MYSNPLSKPVRDVKQKIIEIFCLLIKTNDYEEVMTILECLLALLQSPFLSSLVSSSKYRIKKHAVIMNNNSEEFNLDDLLNIDHGEEDEEFDDVLLSEEEITHKTKDPLYKQSSFYKKPSRSEMQYYRIGTHVQLTMSSTVKNWQNSF